MSSENVEHTPDGRYIVVKGRRWRATDPSIPEPLRAELVSALMTGRRMVRTHGDAARMVGGDDWREHLDTVAEVVAQLREEGVVRTQAADAAEPVRIAAAQGLEFQPNLPG